MDKTLPILDPGTLSFPNPDTALKEPNGLLAMGGDLSPSRLLAAYRLGIFPWYDITSPILWWSPNPRAILFVDQINISKSLQKLILKKNFHYSCDRHFVDVIEACQNRKSHSTSLMDTWITPELKKAFIQLHEMGYAHSIEICQNGKVVGGLYGICIGKCFFGESMFHKVSDMSKVALVLLVRQLARWGFRWIDCQIWSPHLASLGAQNISRESFLSLLSHGIDENTKLENWTLDSDLTD